MDIYLTNATSRAVLTRDPGARVRLHADEWGSCPVILLFTDFGHEGPYVGQVTTRILTIDPEQRVVDLMSDAPAFDPKASAYILASLLAELPAGVSVIGVVDPSVGTDAREPVALLADGRWFIGPGNGLFSMVARRSVSTQWFRISYQPAGVSPSFHGRDLFAPVAARVMGDGSELVAQGWLTPIGADDRPGWPDDLGEVVYVDAYGNVMTGLRGEGLGTADQLRLPADPCVGRQKDRLIPRARVFADVSPGELFWYENSNGLVEVAMNRGDAARELALTIGSRLDVISAVAEPVR